MNRKLIMIGTGILAVLILAAGVLVATHKPTLHGVVISPAAPATEINLTDSNGQPFSLNSQLGKVVLLYFGYTSCPDDCPATMAKLKLTMGTLGQSCSKCTGIDGDHRSYPRQCCTDEKMDDRILSNFPWFNGHYRSAAASL